VVLVRGDINAIVRAINVIDVDMAIRLVHDGGTGGAAVTVRGRVVRVSFDLDYPARNPTYLEKAANELGGYVKRRTGEKMWTQQSGHTETGLDKLWKT
jgi:hypothetical protein